MSSKITVAEFRADRHGGQFSDVVDDTTQPFRELLRFFNDQDRQRRMEDAEVHHSRAPLAGVVRELEAEPEVQRVLSGEDAARAQRLRQTVGILVRMVMERRGWKKNGRTGTLGVRAETVEPTPIHNERGLALWFARAERYSLIEGMPYPTVGRRLRQLGLSGPEVDSDAE